MPHAAVQTSTRPEPLAVSIGRATQITSLGRTTIYEALGSGDLTSLKVGGRRLILVDDLRDWLVRHKQGTR